MGEEDTDRIPDRADDERDLADPDPDTKSVNIDARVRFRGQTPMMIAAILCALAFMGVAIALKSRVDQSHRDQELVVRICQQNEVLKSLLVNFIAKTTGYNAKTQTATAPKGAQPYTPDQAARIVAYNILARQSFAPRKCQ